MVTSSSSRLRSPQRLEPTTSLPPPVLRPPQTGRRSRVAPGEANVHRLGTDRCKPVPTSRAGWVATVALWKEPGCRGARSSRHRSQFSKIVGSDVPPVTIGVGGEMCSFTLTACIVQMRCPFQSTGRSLAIVGGHWSLADVYK